MASDQANIVGKVNVDTTAAVRSVGDLKRAVDQAGGGFAGFAATASKAMSTAADALGKLNLALGGVEKLVGLATDVAEMVKFSAEVRNAEARVKALGVSAYEMGGAVGGTVDDVSLLRFAMKQLQGESALTKDQLLLVLKAADNLGDQGFGETMKIAEDLATALKGGPTRALREYNIAIDESIKGTAQVSGLMEKFTEIANEPVAVDEQLEAIERVGAGWKNMVADVKVFVAEILTAIYDMFDDLTDVLAGVEIGAEAAADRNYFKQRKLNLLRNEEIATLATSVTDKFKPAKPAKKPGGPRKSGAGVDREMAAWLGGLGGGEFTTQDPSGGGDAELDYLAGNATFGTGDGGLSADIAAYDVAQRVAAARELAEAEAKARELKREQDEADRIAYEESARTLDVYAQSANLAAEAVWNLGDAMFNGTGSVSAFLKDIAKGVSGLGKDAAFKAVYYLAEGWAMPWKRAESFAAAKFYGAAAALAIPTAAAISAAAGGGGGASSASPAAGGFAGPTLTSSGRDDGGLTINVQGNLYGDPAAFGRAIADAVDKAARAGSTRPRGNRWQ